MAHFKFGTQDFILYILNKLEPDKSSKIKLNKIAFLVEFAFVYKNKTELSDSKFAAIKLGPVINNYSALLEKMEATKLLKIDGYKIRPLVNPKAEVPVDISNFIDPLIKKYSLMTDSELVGLTHSTDSYKITTDNERKIGGIIDKKLAVLETFFDDDQTEETQVDLPKIKREDLVDYEF